MFNFFESLITWVSTIASLIINAITGIIELITITLSLVGTAGNLFILMPAVLSASFALVVAICVVKLLIGR